jgi:hypothetical protein
VPGHCAKCPLVVKEKIAELRFANTCGVLQHRLEHGAQFAGRRTDNAQHFRRGSLLLERFAQFSEQPRVLDGDDGLGGETLQQRDLLVREWTNFLAVDAKEANKLIVIK